VHRPLPAFPTGVGRGIGELLNHFEALAARITLVFRTTAWAYSRTASEASFNIRRLRGGKRRGAVRQDRVVEAAQRKTFPSAAPCSRAAASASSACRPSTRDTSDRNVPRFRFAPRGRLLEKRLVAERSASPAPPTCLRSAGGCTRTKRAKGGPAPPASCPSLMVGSFRRKPASIIICSQVVGPPLDDRRRGRRNVDFRTFDSTWRRC